MRYADVVLENKSKHIDNYFTYRSGNLDLEIGSKVRAPFVTKEKTGYVFALSDETSVPEDKLKDIISVDKAESLNSEMVSTCIWMKKKYGIKYYDAVRCFIPPGKSAKDGRKKNPYEDFEGAYTEPEALTEEQEEALGKIQEALEDGSPEIFLIHGVTASGKTQVYMEAIEKTMELGKTAIMLVPEISLTNQVIQRFIGKFGKDKVAVLHSKLTQRERYDEWERLRTGKAKIVVGARMGVFAPLENIGLIILDEEHEATYKADMTPKYDTVEVAAKRAQHYGAALLLGSATPSVISYQRFRDGIYNLIELKERYNKTPLPRVDLVDMRAELRSGNTSIFSGELHKAIEKALENKEQVILLQNRRGYSNFISCRECGHVVKCPECEISMTYHKSKEALVCHYCGKVQPVPKKCPECGSGYIKYFGIGTEQVEEMIQTLFPDAKVERLDLDAVKNRKTLDGILGRFAKGKTDILVGTQLVAKGLDFKNVSLVGVISADTTLNIPDYRSQERTFQLITQVAGRAGRGSSQGRVIVQTYEPDNYALKAAQNHNYSGFFSAESHVRQLLEYPPYGDIITASFTSDVEKDSIDGAMRCKAYMEVCLGDEAKQRILSPKISLGYKEKESYRYYILLKCPKGERNRYVYYLDSFEEIIIRDKLNCNLIIDVNPYSI